MRITDKEMNQAQRIWGEWILELASVRDQRKILEEKVIQFLNEVYAYDVSKVLFKPTKASDHPFRLTKNSAKSYFIGGDSAFPEDKGFAVNPWKAVRFDNAGFIEGEKRGFAMGHYYFKDEEGKELKVEYTFGYIRGEDERLIIEVHHSSFPYRPEK